MPNTFTIEREAERVIAALSDLAKDHRNCAHPAVPATRIYLDGQEFVFQTAEETFDLLKSSDSVHQLVAQFENGSGLFFFLLWKDDGSILAELLKPLNPSSHNRAPTLERAGVSTIVA